ncbi:MAG: hypothetical protein NTY77_04820 [Elusimicrobia bacterium]|nr:hypothetical protein [Elusimicrobiota bacterium]
MEGMSCLLAAAALAVAMGSSAQAPGAERIVFPDQLLKDYDISLAASAALPDKGRILVFGFEAKDLLGRAQPLSYLAVYKVDASGAALVYRFAPKAPESAGYPRQLVLEQCRVVPLDGKGLALVTTWGETGANYFGTHPIVIGYAGGKFRAQDLYAQELAADRRIRGFSWTKPDFQAVNFFAPAESVKTILTQGVAVSDAGQVELKFYADEKAHAAKHRFATFRFPVPR